MWTTSAWAPSTPRPQARPPPVGPRAGGLRLGHTRVPVLRDQQESTARTSWPSLYGRGRCARMRVARDLRRQGPRARRAHPARPGAATLLNSDGRSSPAVDAPQQPWSASARHGPASRRLWPTLASRLGPLGEHRRRVPLRVAVAVALVLALGVCVGLATVHDLSSHGGCVPAGCSWWSSSWRSPGACGVAAVSAVLGPEALLAFQIIVTCLALVVAAVAGRGCVRSSRSDSPDGCSGSWCGSWVASRRAGWRQTKRCDRLRPAMAGAPYELHRDQLPGTAATWPRFAPPSSASKTVIEKDKSAGTASTSLHTHKAVLRPDLLSRYAKAPAGSGLSVERRRGGLPAPSRGRQKRSSPH